MSAVSHTSWRNRAPSDENDDIPTHMMSSFMSTASHSEHAHALGGTIDAAASSEDEEDDLKNPELETMVTLVGNVKDRPVFIVDDMIDKSASWIAAAETEIRAAARALVARAADCAFGLGLDRVYLSAPKPRRDFYLRQGWLPIEEDVGTRKVTVFMLERTPRTHQIR